MSSFARALKAASEAATRAPWRTHITQSSSGAANEALTVLLRNATPELLAVLEAGRASISPALVEHVKRWHRELRSPFQRCYCNEGEFCAALDALDGKVGE
jgi:hypothetical protein